MENTQTWSSDLKENAQIWSSDLKENARFFAEDWKNRDLSRRMGNFAICRGKRKKSRFVAENWKFRGFVHAAKSFCPWLSLFSCSLNLLINLRRFRARHINVQTQCITQFIIQFIIHDRVCWEDSCSGVNVISFGWTFTSWCILKEFTSSQMEFRLVCGGSIVLKLLLSVWLYQLKVLIIRCIVLVINFARKPAYRPQLWSMWFSSSTTSTPIDKLHNECILDSLGV